MAKKVKHGAGDDNFIHPEEHIEFLRTGVEFTYVKFYKALGKRFSRWRQALAPSKARLNERWIENAMVLRALPPPPARILDMGGATSPLPMTLAMLGYDVTVVDLRPYGLSHPALTKAQGDVRVVSSLKPPYDAAYTISVVEHAGLARYGEAENASESGELVQTLARLVSPRGPILVTVPFGEAHVPKVGDRSAVTGRPTGFRVFDREMLKVLCGTLVREELHTFGLRDGSWSRMKPEDVEKIPLRRYATGVAFLRLRKP